MDWIAAKAIMIFLQNHLAKKAVIFKFIVANFCAFQKEKKERKKQKQNKWKKCDTSLFWEESLTLYGLVLSFI